MPSLWNEAERGILMDRLRGLTPEATPRWGRLTARGMLAHLHDAARMALGELDVAPKMLPIRYTPIKQLVIYALPFPRNAPTAPEIVSRQADDWEAELSAVEQTVGRLAAKPASDTWCDHPAFGRMSHRAWGVLIYRHMDHHLRQFGQ